ncbi:LacI family DNA-binding transcriptional regulator [Pengzhenrongella sp.]|uniref:LacI family DNA-binding transcriptional regulator n=1 Tax=Pengzhenrongella sp. TaxID=2888820 RepID=UPI002F93DFB7
MTATIRDVANAAGVSASTVSRAFGRPEKVDDDTRRRILAAARALDYQPNRAAQSLITGRTGNIGIVVPDLGNPFFPSVVKGAQTRAHELGYPVLLADTDEDAAAEPPLVRSLARQVDGLILCAPRMSDRELREAQDQCPIVLVNRRVPGIPAVTIDNAGGMGQAANHLRALGHKRVGYVAGPASSYSNLERSAAVEQHLVAAGMTCALIGAYDPSFDGGAGAADAVLLADVSAVIVYNDVMAIGLVSRLTAYGVSIPAELSIVGFDDIPIASMITPPLTTVRIEREQAGRVAIEHLHALLTARRGEIDPPPELGTELVVRGSTARAR